MNYPYLRAWNVYQNGPSDFNVDLAQREKAPSDAIFRQHGGEWATLGGILRPGVKESILKIAVERFGATTD